MAIAIGIAIWLGLVWVVARCMGINKLEKDDVPTSSPERPAD